MSVRRHAQFQATPCQNSGAHLVRAERAGHDDADGQRDVVVQHGAEIVFGDVGGQVVDDEVSFDVTCF